MGAGGTHAATPMQGRAKGANGVGGGVLLLLLLAGWLPAPRQPVVASVGCGSSSSAPTPSPPLPPCRAPPPRRPPQPPRHRPRRLPPPRQTPPRRHRPRRQSPPPPPRRHGLGRSAGRGKGRAHEMELGTGTTQPHIAQDTRQPLAMPVAFARPATASAPPLPPTDRSEPHTGTRPLTDALLVGSVEVLELVQHPE